jgi:hypothetical protein
MRKNSWRDLAARISILSSAAAAPMRAYSVSGMGPRRYRLPAVSNPAEVSLLPASISASAKTGISARVGISASASISAIRVSVPVRVSVPGLDFHREQTNECVSSARRS